MKKLWCVAAVALVCLGVGEARAGGGAYYGPLETQFAEIEKRVPGFAGWHLERDGSAVVRVKDESRAADAIAHVSRILKTRDKRLEATSSERRAARPTGRRVIARPARFSFSELTAIREAIWNRLPFGVHLVDLDEAENVIYFGVPHESVAAEIYDLAAELKLPKAALQVRVTAPPKSRASLWQYQRPVATGNGFSYAGSNSYGDCTVGPTGYWRPNSTTQYAGFLTASHCTDEPFTPPGTTSASQGGSYVGYELVDPAAYTSNFSPCQFGMLYPCRWSDAAFYAYDVSGVMAENTLATTLDSPWCESNGNEVVGDLPITGEQGGTPSGEPLDKIGATSGWTWGWMTRSCVNIGTAAWLICQDETNVLLQSGDSGAALFRWYANDDIDWVGLMHSSDDTECLSWHSPVWAIMTDLPYFSRN